MEFKEVAEYLGFKTDEIKTIEDFKTSFDKEFVKNSNINEDHESVKKILGKTFGTLENEVKKIAKGYELEVDFDSEDLKGKKVTDKLKFVFGEYDKKQGSIIEDLKVKAGQGNDEKVKEWEEKYTKAIGKAKDYESLLKTTKSDFEVYQQNSQKEVKNIKLDIFKTQALSNVKFKSDINDIEKEGYLALVQKNYNIDLDENGKAVVFDKENKRIPNPKVTGTWLELQEVLQNEAIKNKLYQLNPNEGKAKPTSAAATQTATPAKGARSVASRM